MTEINKNEPKKVSKSNKKPKRQLSKPALALVIGLLIIIIPCTIYGGILIHAVLQNNKPVEGDRFKGDLDPKISKDDIAKIEDKLKNLSNVESVKVEVSSGQMRIYLDTKDSLSDEDVEEVAKSAYDLVDSVCSINKYFTSKDSKRMYDLSINAYNFIDSENEDMIYYIVTKNAMMEDKDIQLVSEPLNPELAAELRGELTEEEVEGEDAPTEEEMENASNE